MKKALSIVLTLVMALSLCTAAFAVEELVTIGQTAKVPIKARTQGEGDAGTVYSVDVEWGAMQFTFTTGNFTTAARAEAAHDFKSVDHFGKEAAAEHDLFLSALGEIPIAHKGIDQVKGGGAAKAVIFFNQTDFFALSRGGNCGGNAGKSSADDDNVVVLDFAHGDSSMWFRLILL